jgi:hypothetical protein
MNYTQLLAGMVAGYFLRPHLEKMYAKPAAPAGMGALQMNPRHMGALQMNPAHLGALQMNPAHLGAIDLSGLNY